MHIRRHHHCRECHSQRRCTSGERDCVQNSHTRICQESGYRFVGGCPEPANTVIFPQIYLWLYSEYPCHSQSNFESDMWSNVFLLTSFPLIQSMLYYFYCLFWIKTKIYFTKCPANPASHSCSLMNAIGVIKLKLNAMMVQREVFFVYCLFFFFFKFPCLFHEATWIVLWQQLNNMHCTNPVKWKNQDMLIHSFPEFLVPASVIR